MQAKLNKRLLSGLKPLEKPYEVRDIEMKGFLLRIQPTGQATYYVDYRVNGVRNRVKLGLASAITPEQARDLAKEIQGDVVRGADPAAEKKAIREEVQVKRRHTVKALCEEYIERHAKPHKKSWAKDEWQCQRFIIPAFGKRPVADITKNDISQFHAALGAKNPYQANRVHALLRKMLSLAADWDYLPEGAPNVAKGVHHFREVKRDRWVQPDEFPRLAKAINEHQDAHVRAAIWLYLLTGVRKSELLRVRWADVDIEQRTMRIPETKAGRPHTVPLSDQAVEIVKSIPRVVGCPWLFPSPKDATKHLVNIDKPWRVIRAAAGCDDENESLALHLHDLRRTCGSLMAVAGTPLLTISKALNHSSTAVTEVYARLNIDPVRAALDGVGERIAELSKPKAGEIVALPAKESGA